MQNAKAKHTHRWHARYPVLKRPQLQKLSRLRWVKQKHASFTHYEMGKMVKEKRAG